MAATQVNRGDPTAVTVNSVAFFAESLRTGTFRRNLKGAAPKRGAALAKIAQTENMATGMQTSPDFPIVQINDLSKGAGDTVTVDLVHIIEGKPTMGDRNVEGRLSALTFDDTDIIINQYRHGVDAGGRMSQQRTRWNLGKTAVAALGAWFGRLEDELCQVHLCGGRGSDDNRDWHVPLASDGEYSDIMVNPVTPPTYNRRFIAGGGATSTDIGSADSLRLADIDALRSWLDEMVFPPQPVRLPDDPMSDSEDPFYVLYLTSRQWSYLLLEADLTHNMRQFQADALRRAALTKHPAVQGRGRYVARHSLQEDAPRGPVGSGRCRDRVCDPGRHQLRHDHNAHDRHWHGCGGLIAGSCWAVRLWPRPTARTARAATTRTGTRAAGTPATGASTSEA